VVALDAGFLGGTFFVVAPVSAAPARFRVLWDIRPLARENDAARNELGRWAFLVPGFHDGPLGGRVLPLPSTSSGHPRFLVDAIAAASMGMTVPAQVSVWEWTGTQAVPELIEEYQTTYDVHRVELEGTLLRIATKEDTDVVYSCGSCDEPRGTWTLQLDPDGVRDLGRAFDDPLLKAATDLLSRVARGEDTSTVAAPDVGDKLAALVKTLRADVEESGVEHDAAESEDPYAGVRSMLSSSKTIESGARRVLDLETDDWHLVLTFERLDGADYAVSVEVLAPTSS